MQNGSQTTVSMHVRQRSGCKIPENMSMKSYVMDGLLRREAFDFNLQFSVMKAYKNFSKSPAYKGVVVSSTIQLLKPSHRLAGKLFLFVLRM